MTRGNLRRSAREPKKKSSSEYSVGDLVETVRNGTTVRVRLAQLLTESTRTPNPRWLIRFENNEYKDEEVYEHTFLGKVILANQTSDGEQGVTTMPRSSRGNSPAKLKEPSSLSDSGSSSITGSPVKHATNKDKTTKVSSSDENEDHAEVLSSAKEKARLSAREARTRRRQAMMEDETAAEPREQATSKPLASGKRKLTGAALVAHKNKRQRNDENCVTVKFLTGTLYLYRGPQRRAEFVRRV